MRHGEVWHGGAWRGADRQGEAMIVRFVQVWRDEIWLVAARLGMVRQGQ